MACWNKEEFQEKMSDPSKQGSLLRRFAKQSKSLADKERGAEGDRKTDTQHAAQSPSTEKQHLVPQIPQSQPGPQIPQSQPGPRSNELQRCPVQAMTNLTQSSDFSSPSPLTSQ